MKKPYEAPCIAVERFALTQHLASCSAIKINLTDAMCVLMDEDSTQGMRDFAWMQGFLDAASCQNIVTDGQGGEGLCYHTSSAMAFTS